VRDLGRRELGWPAAATLITAMVGAAVTTVAWAIAPPDEAKRAVTVEYVSAREIGEVKARLAAIEESHRQMRSELRGDIQDLRNLVQQLLKRQ
jgi:hypothetical protein